MPEPLPFPTRQFTGGELVVDQHGDRRIFDSSNTASESLTFTAFYTDCYHEVKEIKSGYRVALTYNLFFKSNLQPIVLKRNLGLEKAVEDYFSEPSENGRYDEVASPRWLVYLLDHEYTRSSLDWSHLRGLDRDRVGELLACADQLGLTTHLTLADVHETWSTEGDDDWGGRYRRRWRDYEEEESDPGDHQLTELIQNEIMLRHWISK